MGRLVPWGTFLCCHQGGVRVKKRVASYSIYF